MAYVTLGSSYFKDLYALASDIRDARAKARDLHGLAERLSRMSEMVPLSSEDPWVKKALGYGDWLYAVVLHRPYSFMWATVRLKHPNEPSLALFNLKDHGGYRAPYVLPDDGDHVLGTTKRVNAIAIKFLGLRLNNIRVNLGDWELPVIEEVRADLEARVARIDEATEVLTRILDAF